MKLEVTQEHIDQGEQCSGFNCALALALNEQIPGLWFINPVNAVFVRGIGIPNQRYNIPESARIFIRRFDEDKNSVEPSTFNLDLT